MDTIRVSGHLDAASVPARLRESVRWFKPGSDLVIDLTGVDRADSAGVALLLEWLRQSKAAHATLALRGAPQQMRAIIAFCGLDDIIPMDPRHDASGP